MKRNSRENSPYKRLRSDTLSSGSEELGSPLKKPKQRALSPVIDSGNYPSMYSDDDKQDSKYTINLVSIRHVVEELKSREREFYLAQQQRLEKIQSSEREFHQSQQNRYDGLARMIGDIEQRWAEERNDRHMREIRRLRQEVKKMEGGINTDKDSTTQGGQASTPPTTRKLLSPPQTTNRRVSVPFTIILPTTSESEGETEASKGEKGDNSPLRPTMGESGKQSVRNSRSAHKTGGDDQMSGLASPFKTTRTLQNTKRATRGSPPAQPADPYGCDGEDGNSFGDFRIFLNDGGSQPSGFLNEDGAIEDIEADPKSPEAEIKEELQQHSVSETPPSDQDRSISVGRTNGVPHTPSTPFANPPRPKRSLRKLQRPNYEVRLNIGLSDEENASQLPQNLPPKQKLKKKSDLYESDEDSYNPTRDITRRKSTSKPNLIRKENTLYRFFKPEAARSNLIATTKHPAASEAHQTTIMPSDGVESAPVQIERNLSSSPATLQNRLGTQSKSHSISPAPGKKAPTHIRREQSGNLARDKYRVVRTSPVS